jgi:hypothetical protein
MAHPEKGRNMWLIFSTIWKYSCVTTDIYTLPVLEKRRWQQEPIICAKHALIVTDVSIPLSHIYVCAIIERSHSYTCVFSPSYIRTQLHNNDPGWSNSSRISLGAHCSFALMPLQGMYLWRNTEARSCNRCSGTAKSMTHCKCMFVSLGIQHGTRMHCMTCPALQYFSTFSNDRHH